jgi:hypothetical protein
MAVTNLHSASVPRRIHGLHELAEQLYALIASGHDTLAYNVGVGGPVLVMRGPDGKLRAIRFLGEGGPLWQRARELHEGIERDRRFNAWVLERHLLGHYSVAPAAAGWVQWVALDIDAHPAAGAPEHVARQLARARADRVLAGVWRALGCSAERHPLILRSPGGGYHVWIPLTRGEGSANPEHTWPAAIARAWVERHLVAAGLELAPGVLEVYPSGRCLRAPCGRGMVMLRASQPDRPEALALRPWPGTAEAHVDWMRDEPTSWRRCRVPMVQAFLDQWTAQRRTLADWLGRPEASWDPTWGFLGWRDVEDEAIEIGEISLAEKKREAGAAPKGSRSQESDDVLGRPQAVGNRIVPGRQSRGSASSIPDQQLTSPPEDPDLPPDPAGGRLVRGRAFLEKVRRLLLEGVAEPSTRHDAVLTLAFYWAATCGLPHEQALARLEAWCRAHPHQGSRLAQRPRAFLATCLREARHYIEHHGPMWRFRGRGTAGLATLTPADHAVVSAADPQVAGEVATILAWLAGRADPEGRIADPVQMSARLLARLCGDRRINAEGKRRRATTLALEQLEQLGVITMASEYRVGQRGRLWSCWYQIGSGVLARRVSVPKAQWDEIEPFTPKVVAPTLAIVESPPVEAPSAPVIEVRVLGELVVREGLVRVLSDGVRGPARTLITAAPDVQRPTVMPTLHEPWFMRAWLTMPFTPGGLFTPNAAAMVIAFPDVEARRRMPRRQRLAWGGGGASGSSGAASPLAPVIPLTLPPEKASEPVSPIATTLAPAAAAPANQLAALGRSEHELRAELAAEAGAEVAAAVPLDLLEVILHAYGGFRGRGRGS